MPNIRISSRAYWGAIVLASASILSTGVSSQGGKPPETATFDVVRARRFEVVNQTGAVRAVLGVGNDNRAFATGLPAAGLGARDATPIGRNSAVSAGPREVAAIRSAQAATAGTALLRRIDVYGTKPPTAREAFDTATDFVRMRLKNPDSARFAPFGFGAIQTADARRFTITSTVTARADSGAGATADTPAITAGYKAVVRLDGRRWVLDSFEFLTQ